LDYLVTNGTGTRVAAGGVVLGVEETVAVVAVGVALTVAVVGAWGGVVRGRCEGGRDGSGWDIMYLFRAEFRAGGRTSGVVHVHISVGHAEQQAGSYSKLHG